MNGYGVCLCGLVVGALLISCTGPHVENMEPAGGAAVGDVNLRARLPFDPAAPPGHAFVAPTENDPYWWVAWRLPDWRRGAQASVTAVLVNGRAVRDYYLIVGGRVREAPWITKRVSSAAPVVLVVKMLWCDAADYELAAKIQSGGAVTWERTLLTAPERGGGPPGFACYDSFALSETGGMDRLNEPVEIVVAAERSETTQDARSPGGTAGLPDQIRLFRYDVESGSLTAVPFQVFDHRQYAGMPPVPDGMDPRGTGHWATPSESVRLAFLADVAARATRVYCVGYGALPDVAPPSPSETLAIRTGERGTIVENSFYRIDLDPRCGQLNSFVIKGAPAGTPRLTNSTSGTVHWNPDTYGDNGRWGHSFSWDPPERTHVAARGPLLYRVTRSGRMPGSNPEVELSVTYSFWAGVPYVRMSSVMRVTDDYGSLAVRNGELVFDGELFDAFAWKEKSGQIRKIRALHRPDPLIDAPATPAADVPWVALYNTQGRYGLASVALTAYAFDPRNGTPSLYRPAYFLYCHPFWARPLTYFVRAWVYPWGYNDRGPVIPVSQGSTYVEDAAYLPFLLDDAEPFAPVELWEGRLRVPLEIQYGH
ncbi:MAG: hypothetical protein AB1486_01965 [Planctomycetota bacterium]